MPLRFFPHFSFFHAFCGLPCLLFTICIQLIDFSGMQKQRANPIQRTKTAAKN